MKNILLAFTFSAGLCVSSWAGFSEGLAAYNAGNLEQAFQEWEPLAKSGDTDVQVRIGSMYLLGEGTTMDYKQAMAWFIKASEKDNPTAQYFLGHMYSDGLGVTRDYKHAIEWYRKAAEQSHATGQFAVGFMYLQGYGVPKDKVLAYMAFNLANSNGHKDAAKFREVTSAKMTPTQLDEGQELSTSWKPGAPFPIASKTGR